MNAENLDDSLLAEIESYSVKFAQRAGQILLEQFRKPLEVQFKGKKNRDPVTAADRLSEEYLKKAIRDKYPSHSILGEEGGALFEADSPFVWVLDPLDGTANFMNGLPLFAVSIGILWKRQPVAGSIYVPVSHMGTEGVYHASRGRGAFLNNEKISINIQPSGRPLCEVPVQFGSRFRLSGNSRKEPCESRNLGSIALEMALTAGGVFQYAVFGGPKLWDIAAGVVLIKEAGGVSFIRAQGTKSWQILERFQTEKVKDPETLEALGKWSFPLLTGAPETVGKLVKDLHVRHYPLSGLIWRFRSPFRHSGENRSPEVHK